MRYFSKSSRIDKMRKLILLTVVSVFALSGCGESEIEKLKKENATLKSQMRALTAVIGQIQETANYHFKNGQSHLKSRNWDLAIQSFKTVITNFPNDPLVSAATSALASAETSRRAHLIDLEKMAQEARAAQDREAEQAGEPIEYGAFYAKYRTGIIVGKRYKFSACYSAASSCVIHQSMSVSQNICSLEPRFDNQKEYENWLTEGVKYCGPIVASALHGGYLAIHRLH